MVDYYFLDKYYSIFNQINFAIPKINGVHNITATEGVSFDPIIVMGTTMDYGHTMAKSLILCDPNSNPNSI